MPGGETQRELTYPFAGIPTFLRVPICDDLSTLNADVAVLGIPTDEGSPFLPGSRFGPRGIREHSLRLGRDGYYDQRTGQSFLVAELANSRVRDVGDVEILPTDVLATFDNITRFVARVISSGALPVVLGGDHAITFPVVRAYSEPLHVVHFDAHIDYAPFRHGFELTNAHAFRHIHQMAHVRGLTQVGIRSLRNPKSWLDDSVRDGNHVVGMEDFRARGVSSFIDDLPPGGRCYVSIDIDVLDMPLVPGCVSAEPNGMTYAELRDCLVAISERVNVVGFDLVEVNPMLDIGTGVTSYLAAHTIVEFLGHICAQPAWKASHGG